MAWDDSDIVHLAGAYWGPSNAAVALLLACQGGEVHRVALLDVAAQFVRDPSEALDPWGDLQGLAGLEDRAACLGDFEEVHVVLVGVRSEAFLQ